jgi:hypothetical protein
VRVERSAAAWFWPLILIAAGLLLLLDNFLFLGDFNALTLLPLLLVVAGAQVLLRGDLTPDSNARRFGITRGSVEAATLEISSGEIDVEIGALQENWQLREGQHALIAGQFAPRSRPQLSLVDNYAHLIMNRARTPWLSFADWKIGLARDLPWQLLATTHLGQVNLDLSELIIHEGLVATGIGDIRIVTPLEALGLLHVRSSVGDIHVVTPIGYRTRIIARSGRLFNLHVDETRYANPEPNVYVSLDVEDDAPLVEVHVSGTFGDAYLA